MCEKSASAILRHTLTSLEQQFTACQTVFVLNFLTQELPSKLCTSNIFQLHAHGKYFPPSCTSFQQSSCVRTSAAAYPARRLAPSPTASSGPQTGAPAPTAVAQVSPPAPPTETGPVACRLRPDCARSGRAKFCCRGSGGCSRSVHNRHTLIIAMLKHSMVLFYSRVCCLQKGFECALLLSLFGICIV